MTVLPACRWGGKQMVISFARIRISLFSDCVCAFEQRICWRSSDYCKHHTHAQVYGQRWHERRSARVVIMAWRKWRPIDVTIFFGHNLHNAVFFLRIHMTRTAMGIWMARTTQILFTFCCCSSSPFIIFFRFFYFNIEIIPFIFWFIISTKIRTHTTHIICDYTVCTLGLNMFLLFIFACAILCCPAIRNTEKKVMQHHTAQRVRVCVAAWSMRLANHTIWSALNEIEWALFAHACRRRRRTVDQHESVQCLPRARIGPRINTGGHRRSENTLEIFHHIQFDLISIYNFIWNSIWTWWKQHLMKW